MRSRRQISAMLYSLRSPSRTTRIFSSAELCFRVPQGDVLYYLIGRRRVSNLCLVL